MHALLRLGGDAWCSWTTLWSSLEAFGTTLSSDGYWANTIGIHQLLTCSENAYEKIKKDKLIVQALTESLCVLEEQWMSRVM